MAAIIRRDGVDDGMANPRGQTLFIVNLVMVILSTLVVAARFYTRIKVFRAIGPDDWMILSVVPISITMTRLYYAEVKNGFGLHMSDLSTSHFLQAWKYYLVCQTLYKAAVGLAKVSMLLLYLRVFQTPRFRQAVWVVMFIVVGTAIATILPTIFQCTPIKKAWKPSIPGHCIFLPAVWYASSSLAIFTDACIIILPMSQLPSLKLAKGQKIGLAFLFSLGIFIIMTTVVRLTTLGPSTTSEDQSWYQAETNLWLGIEVNTSIICTSIPPLKAPIATLFPRLFPSLNNSSHDRSKSRTTRAGRASSLPANPVASTYSMHAQITSGTGGRKGAANDSDEEITLQGMGGITKKSNVEITYSESRD